jgi:hypothetical protein
MDKRAFKRIPAIIECHCCNIECFGTITDLSENGMFVRSQKISLPLDSQFEIRIPLKEEVLNVSVKVNRITKSSGYYDGICVELLNPPQEYLEFVDSLEAAW